MRIIKFILKSMITIFLLAGCLFTYATYIEPHMITTDTIRINTSSASDTPVSLKIIQFSDTHLGFQFDLKQLEKTVAMINKHKPDLVVFTGDLIDHAKSYDHIEDIGPILAKIEAPLGKYAVYGNHDYGGGAEKHYQRIMIEGGFKLLVNEVESITLENGAIVAIGGLDEMMLGEPDPQKLIESYPSGAYTILLTHEPDLIDYFTLTKPNLTLAGHSHGGQIQLPFYGPVITTAYAEKYIEGEYALDSEGLATIHVNTGLGTTKLPMRFLTPPVLSIIDLYHKTP